jgi:hypothetical protein
MRILIFLAFLLSGLVVTFSLASCAGYLPPTITLRADGVFEHLDTQDSPCGVTDPRAGCYEKRADGSRHIWASVMAPWYVDRHETAHDKSMRHTKHEIWWSFGWTCATVTQGDSEGVYRKGDTICVTQTTELILHHGA